MQLYGEFRSVHPAVAAADPKGAPPPTSKFRLVSCPTLLLLFSKESLLRLSEEDSTDLVLYNSANN